MSKGKEAGKIQVYVRVRPFTEREKEKREPNAIEIHQEHSLIRVLDPRSRTNYFFDGVFSPEATNQELYLKVGKPLVYAALNGYKGTLLTYGQTGTGKTFTLLSDDGVTTRVVQHCFEKIDNDEIHTYKVMCSFLQVYQEKVYDLLNPRFIVDLPVREHPKKGVYVANLTQHEVKSAGDVFALLEIGKQHLVIAETKMVRQSSRSHSIMQLIIERRLKEHIANEKPQSKSETSVSHEAVQESIMAVDETINNLIKELKQERKSHHKRERECLKELMEKELNNGNNFEGDLIVKGKINLCDLAGSERLTKTKAEGVRLTEAKYLNTSLLELGNVIYALARGHKRHVPYRNSTLTRLLQDCLGDNGKTNFIICIAPSLAEVNETKCSLNFGLRAMRITNVARLNVEVDYKVLAERLAKKLEDHDIKYKFEKLEYLREIQRLKSAISCYQESENFAGKDHEKLVSVIANLSKSVQREKEEKNHLHTELVCLKKQVSQPMGSAPDVEAVLLAELMSMELLANLQTPDVAKSILADSSLPAKVKSHLALADTQEALLNNAGCFLQLLDLHLESDHDGSGRKLGASAAEDCVQFNLSSAGAVELFSKDCSIKISPRGAPQEPCLSLPMYNSTGSESTTGLAGGVRRMLGKLIGRDTKERTSVSPDAQPTIRPCANAQGSVPGSDVRTSVRDQGEAMIKTKALLKQLTSSKEKVEQQVLNLMSSLFEEQIVSNEGQSPQWNELGKKLTRLIMFRRNNMPGLNDADLWANSEALNSILENCLRFVIIDKALLACLLVIELLDLRQACGKLGSRKQFPGTPDKSIVQESTLSPTNLDETPGVKGNTKSSASNGNKKVAFSGQEGGMNMPKGSVSPRREKLKNLKHSKTELEKEISDMHEDTTKLETELFSTMEEKTKVEEELFGMKHHVTKLRSELFHLKLEKSNLESDVKKSTSQDNLQQYTNSDNGKLAVESPKETLRGYPELSDVMEVSHESNDSENSSQMSDGNETREAFLKTCMENISKIYTLMPNPDEEIASEDELSDDQEPTLSDANIDDSDEEIIITKLARNLRSPCISPAKEKAIEAPSPSKSAKKDIVSSFSQRQKVNMGNENSEDLKGKSKEALVKQILELKRKLHKAETELADARETSEDLEEELDHKKGQLAEAQETITNLENQVVEEKETCEQVRQEYFNVKTQNEILDEKIKALRSELERVLVRENNALSSAFKPTESMRKDNPPPSPTKTSARSPLKSPGKTKISKIDLRNPPPKQLTANEMEVVGLIEENAELRVKLGKATQEKAQLEKSQKLVEEKSKKTTAALQASEDACNRFKNELAVLVKEKVTLADEVADLKNNNSQIEGELQKYRDRSSRVEKDIEAIAYMSTRLEQDNKSLEMEIFKLESELTSCKSKHEVASQECKRLNQERVRAEKECEKVLHDLESLRKEKHQLVDSEVSEQKRLNSNLEKELAGMAEYQEALENEYSKAKSAEERLKQELAKVRARVIEVETELGKATQNIQIEEAITNHREGNLSLAQDFHRNPKKPELKGKKSFTGTPSKKFYTITHTSEDEIGDTSSSIAESPADESKQIEHENQLLKLENGYLQQQLAESEHVLTMYRQDLESAHDLIDKLQAKAKVFAIDNKNRPSEEDCKTPSDKDDTIKEIEDYHDNANDEYKLLEEKHAELTKEYEILRQQYQEALTDKEKETEVTKEISSLTEDGVIEDRKERVVSKLDVSGLQAKIKELQADNVQLKLTADELSRNEKANNASMKSLEDAKREKIRLEERINKLESENAALRVQHDVTAVHKDKKSVRRRSLDDQATSLKETKEMLQSASDSHNHQMQLQDAMKEQELRKTTGDNEIKIRKLEEDLLKVTSEKLKLEFELRSAANDCERLKNNLDQSESERNLLNTQLNDNIEKAANLEIRLMEMRCSCETIQDEINTLKNQKRQESLHLHEASVCKEILEKRLKDALKENNVLRQELDTLHEERKENEKNNAKLEKEKDQLTKEIDYVKTQIRRLEQEFEESKVITSEMREEENNKVDEEMMTQGGSSTENVAEYIRLHEEDQEQLTLLREEMEKMSAEHNGIKTELKEIRDVKESLENQIENIKSTTMEDGEQCDAKGDKEIVNCHNENTPDCKRTTFDTLEIEKHTKLLEKEKRLLEKELTRVQEECIKLKEKLEVIKHATKNEETQEEKRKELEGKQELLEKELQELRQLNHNLELECDDSHKLIQELEIKTKALENLQRELQCFHKENDRLTHEVDIIHNTSKAMTDHQRSKESLETENSLLKQELKGLTDRNRELQMQTEDLRKELLTLKGQSKNISQSTEKRNSSLQSQVEHFQKMQQHLENELASTREKTKELEIGNESLKKENKAVKGRIKSLEQRHEELRRKDDKKKASIAENKTKAKSKLGQNAIKENKEAPTVENKHVQGNESDLKEKVEQMQCEKAHLEEQLNSLKEKVNSEFVAVPLVQVVTIETQTTEFQPEDKAVQTATILENHDQELNIVQKSEKESAPLTEDMKTGFSLMAKEKLLLEKKASRFARAQMQLEQSFAKALKENAALKAKVGEAENVLEILREKVHELEKKHPASMSVVDLKKNVLMSSDSECDSEEEAKAKNNIKEGHKKTQNVEVQESAKSSDGFMSHPFQSEVDQLRSEKEQLIKELALLKTQKENIESFLKQTNNVEISTEKGADVLQQSIMSTDGSCIAKSTQVYVAQLQSDTEQLTDQQECLDSQKEDMESVFEQKEDLGITREKDEEVQRSIMTDDQSCVVKSTQVEVYQLPSEKGQIIDEQDGLKSQKEGTEGALDQNDIEPEGDAHNPSFSHDDRGVLNPTKSEVDQLSNEKEKVCKELTGLKSQKEDTGSVLKQKEDLENLTETKSDVQHSIVSNDYCCLSKATQSEVEKLRIEKEKLEEDMDGLKTLTLQLETDLKQKTEIVGTLNETHGSLEKLEEENTLLKQERKSLLEELEAAKSHTNLAESELRHNKESCLKQEQEIILLLSSYNQEKESLLKEVENTRNDCRKGKEKLRELQQIESDFEDIRKKSREAEKLITELEKDLLSQTEMKNELKRELQNCKNQLQEMDYLEQQLRTCRTENEDLHKTNKQLMEEVKKWKNENESKNTRLQMQRIEKQKKNSLHVNSSMRCLQNQGVQTDPVTELTGGNNLLDDNATLTNVKNDSANTNHGEENNVGSIKNNVNGVDNNIDSVKNNVDGVENNSDGVETLSQANEMGANCNDRNSTGVSEPGGLDATKKAKTDQTFQEIGVTATNSKETNLRGVPIPVIIVSHFDDIETSGRERVATLSLRIEDFESDSPNEQSTPDDENEHFKPSLNKENGSEMQMRVQPLDTFNKSLVQKDAMSMVNLPQGGEHVKRKDRNHQEESINIPAPEPSTLDAENNLYEPSQQRTDDGPRDALSSAALENGEFSTNDTETHYINTVEDVSESRRELEWTISSLKLELAQSAEENEKNQREIGLLVEEKLSMKTDISTLLSECESLRAKATSLRTQNEAVLKEQILNDEELEEIQQNLKDLKQEKDTIEEAKRNLESEKARLEIELSDAIETREAMEKELLRIRSEDTDVSKHRLEAQLHDISERYSKLETVLSCVLDENSQMTAELAALQAENNMLKSFKIMEITDNFTQFSPRTTEDESDGEGALSARRGRNGTATTLLTSKANLTLSLDGNLTNLPLTSSPSSFEAQRKFDSSVTPSQAEDDERTNTKQHQVAFPTASHPKRIEPSTGHVEDTFDEGGESVKRDRVPVTAANNHEASKTRYKASSVGTPPFLTGHESVISGNWLPQRKQQKHNSKKNPSLHKKYDAKEGVGKRDDDDNDSSMEGHNNTSSSLVSGTDLDISISSDQISSEDSSIVGSEIRVLQRMQKELAETKCSNVLVKNELSIIRKHNSDLQTQVQKLLSRNNHLKTKMCDRTLSVKRMEKEVSSIQEENNRLQQHALALQEEMARVEKEKAKLERNMSSTKSENKRLKSDLSNIKAESYRTMKELVNLQSENRKLQLEIVRLREEVRSFKGAFSDESVSQELSLWGSSPNGEFRSTSRRSLQERPAKPELVYLQQRASSDLAFNQHQGLTERPETPELSPLNLSKELHEQHSDGGNYSKGLASTDTVSVNSTGGSRSADPMSRRGSPLSFTSEGSLPSEPNDRDEHEHSGEKVEEQGEEEGKGKNKKKIKTILRKLQHSKKSKSSK